MKIHINSKLKNGAWGGGNQFLKALRNEFMKTDNYIESVNQADAVIFNSYQDLWPLVKYFFSRKKGKIIYRLGPIFYLHRGLKWKAIDCLVIIVANLFSDLIIFQSQWSYKQALALGFSKKKKYSIIHNAVDKNIFFTEDSQKEQAKKIKLIYTSWSANLNKGFNYLDFLDKNLDFNKYELEFIGNSPLLFKNIKMFKPLQSSDLALELRNSDIYISPAKDDACSNAILEALACGLPVVALDSGSNPELVQNGGALFHNNDTLLSATGMVASDLELYKNQIPKRYISQAMTEYVAAINTVC